VTHRYLYSALESHLNKLRQMIFLVGPRQVGKTTLAKSLLTNPDPGINYFNWDFPEHRKVLLSKVFSGSRDILPQKSRLVFDEIHKYSHWKNTLKGLFDVNEPDTHWIITGSAMLNVHRKGQDSMLGRYFLYHLFPFSVAEMVSDSIRDKVPLPSQLTLDCFTSPTKESLEHLLQLMHFSGFPEPLFQEGEDFLPRWRANRLDRLINQDLAATENLRNLSLVEKLVYLLPERVGSPLSINSLREDIQVHFQTVKHWLELLERVFYGFFVLPWSKKNSRMLNKEAKWYLWDWSEITDEGNRFENLIAVHLLKYVRYVNDMGLGELSLHYVRDKEKRESDFLVCQDRKPVMLVECKKGKGPLDASLSYFAESLDVGLVYQVSLEETEARVFERKKRTIAILPAASFLNVLV